MGIYKTVMQRGDTRPVLSAQLVNQDGTPYPTLGKTVTLIMRRVTTREVVVNAAATVVDNEGRVSYAWQPADTAVAGEYELRFRVDDGGALTSFPNADWHSLRLEP